MGLFRKKSKKQPSSNSSPGNDYSLGISTLQNLHKAVAQKKFPRVEIAFLDLDADHRTQTLDLIGLRTPENTLKQWVSRSKKPHIPQLFLGVYYLHAAWKARSHKVAAEVSNTQVRDFFHLLSAANTCLMEAASYPDTREAALERLIRLGMGEGEMETAGEMFEKCIELNPQNFWAYLHFAELVQPKWGGSLEQVAELMARLPKNRLIAYAVELKFLNDGFVMNENLFGGSIADLEELAKRRVAKIDQELMQDGLQSIHKVMVYNYLAVIGRRLGNEAFTQKYWMLGEGYMGLFPFGIRD